MKYYTVQNNSILIADNYNALTRYYNDVQELPSDYEKGKYIIKANSLILNPNFEYEKLQRERQRKDKLYLTAADVERAIYKAKGLDFDDILDIVKDSLEIDIKALKIELKANNFYRGNPYVDLIGKILGYTSEDLDYLFENKELPISEQEVDNDKMVLE